MSNAERIQKRKNLKHYRLLDKINIKNIIDKKYNQPNTPFELKGYNIPHSENIITNIQEEKRLQWLVNHQLEFLTNEKIKEENYLTEIDKETSGYILEEDLKTKILEINKNTINNFIKKYPKYSINDIVNNIYQDFLNRYNRIRKDKKRNKNIKLHKLFINEDKTLFINLENENISYQVIDFNNPKNNKITIIKEKKLLINNTWEFPDFAIYFNGLPFIVIEMKSTVVNGLVGTQEALKDYRKKESYHNFLGCLGTNGKQTFFSSNPNFADYFVWENYENNEEYLEYYEDIQDRNGLWDFINDIIINPSNMLFYFAYCSMISEDGHYLKSARVQQFKTALKFDKEFKTNKNIINNYFQHHTRTGKSFTFKIITKLCWKKFNNRFKKVLFFTHDVSSVLPTVQKEFANMNLPTKTGNIILIESKEDYKKMLSNPTIFGVYIVNMQKISKDNIIIDSSNEILILIDEVHTHQGTSDNNYEKETMADYRKKHFPNASIIAATASPIIKEVKDEKGKVKNINLTEQLYGKCIDKLTPSDAIRLNLVTKLHYEKINFKSADFKNMFENMKKLENKEEIEIFNKILLTIDNLKEHILNEELSKNNSLNKKSILLYNELKINIVNIKDLLNINISKITNENLNKEELSDYAKLIERLKDSLNYEFNIIKRDIKKVFERKMWELQLEEKIDLIVIPRMLKLRENSVNNFIPKAFYVVPNLIENGKTMLKVIKNMIKKYIKNNPKYNKNDFDIKNNIYRGIRFGFDNEEQDTIEENGDLHIDPTKTFELDEIELKNNNSKLKIKPIDVLILVRKKLMGYDNKNLTAVFLDKRISQENIKEMLQLATRGTTKREGKEMGMLIDLTIDDTNILTYKRAFSIYDNKDNVKDFLLEEKTIEHLIKELKKDINKVEKHFNKDINDINKSSLKRENLFSLFNFIRTKYWTWKQPKNINNKELNKYIVDYINEVKNVEINFKKLIQGSYILNNKNENELLDKIMILFNINAQLLNDIKNKLRTIYKRQYSNEDIIEILENTFSSFGGVNEFIGKFNISYKNENIITTNNQKVEEDKKNKMVTKVSSLMKELKKLTNGNTSSILSSLEKIQVFIDTDEKPLEPKEKELLEIEKLLEEKKKERQKQINRHFNGNENVFEIYITFEEIFEEILGNDYSDILKIYSNELNNELNKKSNSLSIDLNKTDTIKEILEKVDFASFGESIDLLNEKQIELLQNNFEILLGENSKIIEIQKDLLNDINQDFDVELIENKLINVINRYI